jgi:hypothetical protein
MRSIKLVPRIPKPGRRITVYDVDGGGAIARLPNGRVMGVMEVVMLCEALLAGTRAIGDDAITEHNDELSRLRRQISDDPFDLAIEGWGE